MNKRKFPCLDDVKESNELQDELKRHPYQFRKAISIICELNILPVKMSAIVCEYCISLLEFNLLSEIPGDENGEYDVFVSTVPIKDVYDGRWMLKFKSTSVYTCGFRNFNASFYDILLECDPIIPHINVLNPKDINFQDYKIVVEGRPNEISVEFDKPSNRVNIDVDKTVGNISNYIDVQNYHISVWIKRMPGGLTSLLPDDVVSYRDDNNDSFIALDVNEQKYAKKGDKIAVLSVDAGYVPAIVLEHEIRTYPRVKMMHGKNNSICYPSRWTYFGCSALK